MNSQSNSPTAQNYAELQHAYEHFNRTLFDGQLPSCLITLQREKRTVGYFSQQRFANLDGITTDEIALNPAYFAVVPLTETLQTLVHEMAHLWQFHFGKPGRGRYHNDQWADKMQAIGLMPSSTGSIGGKRTGDQMADYAIAGGRFLASCSELVTKDFRLSWYDRFPAQEQVNAGQASHAMQYGADVGGGSTPSQTQAVKECLVITPAPASENAAQPMNKSNRVKYECDCGQKIWGKPNLQVLCALCKASFTSE